MILDYHTSASHVHFEDEIASSRHARAPRLWPPPGLNYHSKLTSEEAEMLICKGACVFEGFLSQVPHGSAGHVRYNASASTSGRGKNVPPACTSSEQLGRMAIVRIDSMECCSPWEFLAQPVMTSPFGAQPGTITLDHWVSMAGHPVVLVDDTEEGLVKPREMEFFDVLNRLKQLQQGEISGDVCFHSFPFEISFWEANKVLPAYGKRALPLCPPYLGPIQTALIRKQHGPRNPCPFKQSEPFLLGRFQSRLQPSQRRNALRKPRPTKSALLLPTNPSRRRALSSLTSGLRRRHPNNGNPLLPTSTSSMDGSPGPDLAFHRHSRTSGRR